MDFGLTAFASRVWDHFDTCDVDSFAAPHNSLPRFFSSHDTHTAEATDVFSVSWSSARFFTLTDFWRGFIDWVLDKIERDNASVACIVPIWSRQRFWLMLLSRSLGSPHLLSTHSPCILSQATCRKQAFLFLRASFRLATPGFLNRTCKTCPLASFLVCEAKSKGEYAQRLMQPSADVQVPGK